MAVPMFAASVDRSRTSRLAEAAFLADALDADRADSLLADEDRYAQERSRAQCRRPALLISVQVRRPVEQQAAGVTG